MTVVDTHATPVPPAPPSPNGIKTPVSAKRKPYPERVAARAESIKFTRVLLAILAAPFYLIGLAAGIVWVAASWIIGGIVEGFLLTRPESGLSDDVDT